MDKKEIKARKKAYKKAIEAVKAIVQGESIELVMGKFSN